MSHDTDVSGSSAKVTTDPAKPEAETGSETKSFISRARSLTANYAMFGVLILVAIFARILYSGFLDPQNINNMIAQVVPVGIVALGMTFVMIGGGFDLSVSAIFAAASVSFASLSNNVPIGLAFVASVIVGVLCGVVNGLIITTLRVNPFIATLSTSSMFGGLTYMYAKNLPIIVDKPSFGTLGSNKWGPIWISIYVLVILIVIMGVTLSRTTYGRGVYALGGNQEAARLAGMRVNAIKVSTYMITGACAAIGGMITASQIGVGQPTLGPTITLNSIAIVVIGGTSLLGGEGSIWRTVTGLAIWAVLNNVFTSLAFSTGVQLFLLGLIVLLAVALDTLSRRTRT